jgi:hypothetical protein
VSSHRQAPSHPTRDQSGRSHPASLRPADWGSLVHFRLQLSALCASLALLALYLAAPSASAAGDANQAGCPAETETSPGFRTYLPDCRAYEMVSPPFKQGFPVEEILARSADGLRLIGQSLGAFAGTEADNTALSEEGGAGAIYEFLRGPAGWSTVPLGPPPSLFPEGVLVTESASLKHTLWRLRLPAQPAEAQDLYVREAAGPGGACPGGALAVPGACFTDIGTLRPPGRTPIREDLESNFAGASADLSHVLIRRESRQGLWPGDETTGEHSLYEYAPGAGSEPSLVGVHNVRSIEAEAQLQHKTHINEAAELISRCGTRLGAPESADTYNAISASGATVFFTVSECFEAPGEPAVNELYARLGGAQTVALSEPTSGPGGDCEACDTSAPAEAFFQGASEDGTRAYFLSEQAGLLPGAAGQNLYLYDFAGPAHEKLVRLGAALAEPEVRGVLRVSEDGQVYFLAGGVLAANLNANGESAAAGADNLYLYRPDSADPAAATTTFVARLCSGAGESGAVSDPGCQGSDEALWSREDTRPAGASADGRFLVFSSFARLSPDDTSSVQQIFEYDSQNGAIVRASRGQLSHAGSLCPASAQIEARFNCDGNTANPGLTPLLPIEGFYGASSPAKVQSSTAVSEDGSTVVFEGADALAPGAVEGLRNVYEYRAGNVYLISDGQDPARWVGAPAVRLLGTDASGADVFFTSADRILGQDTDTQIDVYDARAGGGFPAPPEPFGCPGESCQGPPSPPPLLPAAATSTFTGEGNQRQHKKKKHHKHKRHSRRAGHHRGGTK